jgi:membrane-associated protease RseP (regulator of RpoE activity)
LESFRAAAISLPRIGTDLIKATLGIEDEKEFKGDPELSANWGLLGGIIGVGVFASESTESFLNIFIVISIAVVLLNAVPYPAFDGGQIFVLFIEKLRGEELSFLMKERIAFFGLASSVLLTVAAFGSDIYTTITLVFFG